MKWFQICARYFFKYTGLSILRPRCFLFSWTLTRILFRKINSTAAKSALIETAQVEYSLYFQNYYQILNKNVTYKRLYILISTLDVSTYLDIEWEEEETEKCEVSFKKQCETLNKTVSKNFTNFLDNFSSGATEAGHRAF